MTRFAFVRPWLTKGISFSPPAFGLMVLALGVLAPALKFDRGADYKVSLSFLNEELAWFASHQCNSAALPVVAEVVDICLPIYAALLVLLTGVLALWTATERLFGQLSKGTKQTQAGARAKLLGQARLRWTIIVGPFLCIAALYEMTDANWVTYDSRVTYVLCNAPSLFIALQSFVILECLIALLVFLVSWIYIFGRFIATTYRALSVPPNFEGRDDGGDM